MNFSYEVKSQDSDLKVVCDESTKNKPQYSDPIIIKICEFKNHFFKSIGIADYKGRFSYEYKLFKINKKDTINIKNTDFFNEKVTELEKIINDKLKSKYESNSKIPEISECMKWIDFRYYKLNEFDISFSYKNQMEFNVDYGIGGACFNVSSDLVAFDVSEIEKYLK